MKLTKTSRIMVTSSWGWGGRMGKLLMDIISDLQDEKVQKLCFTPVYLKIINTVNFMLYAFYLNLKKASLTLDSSEQCGYIMSGRSSVNHSRYETFYFFIDYVHSIYKYGTLKYHPEPL